MDRADPASSGFATNIHRLTSRWMLRFGAASCTSLHIQAAPRVLSVPSRPVPSRPRPVLFRPVPSRPAESPGLRTSITIPPSPVHCQAPGGAWPWILSNHLQNPPSACSAYRARTTEDAVRASRLCRLASSGPDPASPPEPRGPFPAVGAARSTPRTMPGVGTGVVYPWTCPGHVQGYPTTRTHPWHGPRRAPGRTHRRERASGLSAARRATAGSRRIRPVGPVLCIIRPVGL